MGGIPAPTPEWTAFLREFGLPTMLVILLISIFVIFSVSAWRFYKPLKESEVETRNRTLQTLANCAESQDKSIALATQTLGLIYQSITENFGKMFEKQEALHRDFRGIRCAEEEDIRKSWRGPAIKPDDKAGS